MKWSMDTHKYISEITRKALQVISSHGITSDSSPEEIDAVERELGSCGVYRDYEGAKGRVRRALFTYFKAYGCLDDSEQLTELGRLYVDNKITVREFSFYYILNYMYENEDIKYYPAEMVLSCYYKLYKADESQAYLSAYDFSQIVECDSLEDINDEFIGNLIAARKTAPIAVNERTIGFDVWAKMFVQAGIFKRNEEKNLISDNIPLIEWILTSYQKNFETHMGSICTGVLNNFPIMQLSSPNGDVQNYLSEGKALQAFLFEGVDEKIIDKYILRSSNTNFGSMRTALGIDENSSGFFKIFSGLERLVGYCLSNNDNLQVNTIGKILASIKLTEDQALNLFHQELRMEFDSADRLTTGCNVLLYGVPGSGKSWTIEHEYCKPGTVVERLVFHPDYTNADFIGQILPVVDPVDKMVTYEFTPGPFTNILKEAYNNPSKPYVLIIEEINRGNAPAIFGDVFQLLDRTVEAKVMDGVSYPKGTSEYGITNKNIAKVVYDDGKHKVRIPSNLSILGTMNTSDQNVFTLDTAFQRRWNMRLIENNFNNVRGSLANAEILDTKVTWQKFCETVNTIIIGNRAKMASAEDKRLGVYFVHEQDLEFDSKALPTGDFVSTYDELNDLVRHELLGTLDATKKARLEEMRDAILHNRLFPEKVIKYLWDDAFKFNPEAIFDTENMDSLEKVIRTFVYSKGADRFKIFKQNVRDTLYPTQQ